MHERVTDPKRTHPFASDMALAALLFPAPLVWILFASPYVPAESIDAILGRSTWLLVGVTDFYAYAVLFVASRSPEASDAFYARVLTVLFLPGAVLACITAIELQPRLAHAYGWAVAGYAYLAVGSLVAFAGAVQLAARKRSRDV